MFCQWKEIYIGTSLEDFIYLKTELEKLNIEIKIKTHKHDDLPQFRGFARNSIGRISEKISCSITYYIYVKKSEYEKAQNLVLNTFSN